MQRILKTAAGQMLFDPDRIESPRVEYFDPDWWQSQDQITARFKGRGQAVAVDGVLGPAVLKIYHRGGFARRISRSRYLYLGAPRTRAFQEWRVTQTLWQAGLPVAEPLAAFFQRSGLSYRAALISRQIEHAQTLADWARDQVLGHDGWQRIGRLLGAFAAFGLHHPDLNARNILIDTDEKLWWIDFDRARITSEPANPGVMHRRLLRSLNKLEIQHDADAIASGIRG